VSIRKLRPSTQPNFCSSCTKDASCDWASELLSGKPIKTPIRRIRLACCARAASGHDVVAAAPPRRVMNSRRFMSFPRWQDHAKFRFSTQAIKTGIFEH
jgi:hypothetical protein